MNIITLGGFDRKHTSALWTEDLVALVFLLPGKNIQTARCLRIPLKKSIPSTLMGEVTLGTKKQEKKAH